MKINLGELHLWSPDFKHGDELPTYATIDGTGDSPPLRWENVPVGTASFALMSTDPDAPLSQGFDHWVLYDIPAEVVELRRAASGVGTTGVNGKGELSWTPAQPPVAHGRHTYYFHLYALDRRLELPSGMTRMEALAAVDNHIIEQARLAATYERVGVGNRAGSQVPSRTRQDKNRVIRL